jgi:hypothetical protein
MGASGRRPDLADKSPWRSPPATVTKAGKLHPQTAKLRERINNPEGSHNGPAAGRSAAAPD